jgi:hypothetical protein
MLRWMWAVFMGLACCGGIAVIDEHGQGHGGGAGAGGEGNAGGSSSGGHGSSSAGGLDGGIGDGADDAGPPVCCDISEGPLPAEECDPYGGGDALCDPGEVCTLIQGDGEWYCLPPGF